MGTGWQWGSRGTLALAGAAVALPAAAAEVTVRVGGLRSVLGTVYVALCAEAEFLRPSCAVTGSAPASEPVVTLRDVAPGTYAVQAVHDENGNRQLDRTGLLPDEGLGFSRDAPMRMGPPRFADAAFALGEAGADVPLTMRYFR
jgi:uncharacterized protein (DUF2141 family)